MLSKISKINIIYFFKHLQLHLTVSRESRDLALLPPRQVLLFVVRPRQISWSGLSSSSSLPLRCYLSGCLDKSCDLGLSSSSWMLFIVRPHTHLLISSLIRPLRCVVSRSPLWIKHFFMIFRLCWGNCFIFFISLWKLVDLWD